MPRISYSSGFYLYLILVAGILLMGWNVREVLMILIADMLIQGVFACARILTAGVYGPKWFTNLLTNVFATGFYATIHMTGWFVMTLFIVLNLESEWGTVDFMAFRLTYFALLFGYSMEFVFGYLGSGKFKEEVRMNTFLNAFVRLVPYAVLLTFSAVLPEIVTGGKVNNQGLGISVIGMKAILDYAFARFGHMNTTNRNLRRPNYGNLESAPTNAGIQKQSSLSQDPPPK